MVERLRTLWSSPLKGDGGLSMAALSVEHLKVLLVEHLKVQFTYWVGGLMVERGMRWAVHLDLSPL